MEWFDERNSCPNRQCQKAFAVTGSRQRHRVNFISHKSMTLPIDLQNIVISLLDEESAYRMRFLYDDDDSVQFAIVNQCSEEFLERKMALESAVRVLLAERKFSVKIRNQLKRTREVGYQEYCRERPFQLNSFEDFLVHVFK